jgi:antitoxin YefM
MSHTEYEYTDRDFNLHEVYNRVLNNYEEIVINHKNKGKVVLMPASDLEILREELYLISSPVNAIRLFTALERSRNQDLPPQGVNTLRQELNFVDPD